jgi:hypothetical protein
MIGMKSSALPNQVKFLLVDLDTAVTFMNIAETTGDEETRQRNCQNARRAYDTVLQLMQKATLNDAQNKAIRKKLALLRIRLEAVGQKF